MDTWPLEMSESKVCSFVGGRVTWMLAETTPLESEAAID
jgi:hypothetical protein